MNDKEIISQTDKAVKRHLSKSQSGSQLFEALEYVMFADSKHLRSLVICHLGSGLGIAPQVLFDLSAAVEMIHAFSLIQDDLPCMDNDAMRRQRPSCHIKFNQATAILSSDALLPMAFEVLAQLPLSYQKRIKMIESMAQAIGFKGMAQGQWRDLNELTNPLAVVDVEAIYDMKTAMLFVAAVNLLIFTCEDLAVSVQLKLRRFALILGRAYQIKDDLIDYHSEAESSLSPSKYTLPAILGIEAAKQRLQAYIAELEQIRLSLPLEPSVTRDLIKRIFADSKHSTACAALSG